MCVSQHQQSHFTGREPDTQADLGDAVSQLQSQDHKTDLFFPQVDSTLSPLYACKVILLNAIMHVFILIAPHLNTPGCLTAFAFIKIAKCQLFTSKYLFTPELMPPLLLLGFHKPSKNAKTKHPSSYILRVISVKP